VIGITVAIQPAKDYKVRAGRLRLSGTEHFQYCTQVSTTDADGNTTQSYSYEWGRNEFYAEDAEFLGETTLASSTPERFTFQTRLPANALPTCMGEILRVEWLVEVKLDRPLAGDLNAKVVVRVPAPAPGREAQPGEYGVSDEPREAELALFKAGQQQVIAFRAPLPPDAAPSIQTEHGALTWTMKGILARRLRRDTSITQEFSVFTGRAAN
jgi:hypothetical protein